MLQYKDLFLLFSQFIHLAPHNCMPLLSLLSLSNDLKECSICCSSWEVNLEELENTPFVSGLDTAEFGSLDEVVLDVVYVLLKLVLF